MSEKTIPTEQEIVGMVNKYHDRSLHHFGKCPNENYIYHIYSDGEITCQKGGNEYGDRAEHFVDASCGIKLSAQSIQQFPVWWNDGNVNEPYIGYAIVTCENAKIIREKMAELCNHRRLCQKN